MVLRLVMFHVLVSIFCFVYTFVMWCLTKELIEANGWTTEYCTPLAEIEMVCYFIPIANVLFTYFADELMEKLARTPNEGQFINVYLWKFGIHYQETD